MERSGNAPTIAASAKCGRNAIRLLPARSATEMPSDCCQRGVRQKCHQNCCRREVRQKCHQNCCQIMTSGQFEEIIAPFEGKSMTSGRFEGNAPPNRINEPAVSMTAATTGRYAAETCPGHPNWSKNGNYCRKTTTTGAILRHKPQNLCRTMSDVTILRQY